MRLPFAVTAADRRVLPEGRLAGPMPAVIAIMMALTVLAAAAGLALGHASHIYTEALSNRVSVQVVEADPDRREAETKAVVAILAASPAIRSVRRLPDAEIAHLLKPWLGGDGLGDLPLPTLVDAQLVPAADRERSALFAAIRHAAPAARIDTHAGWLAPLARLLSTLIWLLGGLVLLMGCATAAVVVLTARGALNTHRATIDVLHLMGGTDIQVARLFQRRLALDALFGSLLGFGAAVAALLLLGHEISGANSALIGALALTPLAWATLLALPFAAALLATVTARMTVVRALRRLP